jgi:hypothetical protein
VVDAAGEVDATATRDRRAGREARWDSSTDG